VEAVESQDEKGWVDAADMIGGRSSWTRSLKRNAPGREALPGVERYPLDFFGVLGVFGVFGLLAGGVGRAGLDVADARSPAICVYALLTPLAVEDMPAVAPQANKAASSTYETMF